MYGGAYSRTQVDGGPPVVERPGTVGQQQAGQGYAAGRHRLRGQQRLDQAVDVRQAAAISAHALGPPGTTQRSW
jgi:hypothetical protein